MSSIYISMNDARAFYAQGGYTQEDREKLEKQIKAREKKYGYKRGSNASLTKPAKYADIPESKFADVVGYNYPVDNKKHARGAVGYWQHMEHRKQYSDPKARAFITERIVKGALAQGIAVSWDSKDPDYQKLPDALKKKMEGYESKCSFLEDQEGFSALQNAVYPQGVSLLK